MTLNSIFLSNLKKSMQDRSGYWLAKQSGISQSTISRILSEHIQPSLDTVEALARALGTPPHELLKSGEPKRQTKIPNDILEELENQDEIVFSSIRALLKAINSKSSARRSKR